MRYDFNQNLLFELDEIEAILKEVFGFNDIEINFILSLYFNYESRKTGSVTFEELFSIILFSYFVELLFRRLYNTNDPSVWKSKRISLEDFIKMVAEACYFVRYRPRRTLLEAIFRMLDTNRDGYISFEEFYEFIKKNLGGNLPIMEQEKPAIKAPPVKSPPTGISDE